MRERKGECVNGCIEGVERTVGMEDYYITIRM